MFFRRISAAILCAIALSLAAPDADSGDDMMLFKAILQSPLFKDNFVQSCTVQSMEWLGADQADKTCNCAFDRMVKDGEFINRILNSVNDGNIDFEKWGFDFIEPCIPQSFPAETDNAFQKECLKSGDLNKATCDCMLSSIKNDYTVHELMKTAFEDQKKLEVDLMLKAAQCLSK
jgi:hypothetical protein